MRQEKLLKKVELHKLMDLKVDFAFKQLFGSEKNKAITIVFLNAILQNANRKPIKNISFHNIEVGGEYEHAKQARLDILAVTNDEERINIEIQFNNKYDMVKRSIYYWTHVYGMQLTKRKSYITLRPAIAINIMNFNLFDQTKRFHTIYHLRENEEKFKLTDVMEFHFIEMPKLIKSWQADQLDPWNNALARWLLMLGMVDRRKSKVYEDIFKELEEIAMKDEVLREAFASWETLSANEEEMLAYLARHKQLMDEEAMVNEAEIRVQEGIEKGRMEGMKEGKKEGKKEVSENIARELLLMGIDDESIMKATGLSKERIKEINQ